MARDSKIDLNRADVEELASLDGLNEQLAGAIVDQREEQGGFDSWEDVRGITGIGPALLKKLQSAATIEQRGYIAEPSDGAQTGGFSDALAGDEPAEEDVLATLARMDLEAALAYDVAARSAGNGELREALESFRDDHLRHIEGLNRVLEARGGPTFETTAGGQDLLLPLVARLTQPFGADAAIVALLVNEQMTNGVYEMVLEFEWDNDLAELLDKNRSDEQRHLAWLSDRARVLAEEDESLSAPI